MYLGHSIKTSPDMSLEERGEVEVGEIAEGSSPGSPKLKRAASAWGAGTGWGICTTTTILLLVIIIDRFVVLFIPL